jgi:hypothetical protein
MRTSFHHQSEAQPPNGPLTAATSPDTPSPTPTGQSVSNAYGIGSRSKWPIASPKAREPELAPDLAPPAYGQGFLNYAPRRFSPAIERTSLSWLMSKPTRTTKRDGRHGELPPVRFRSQSPAGRRLA